MLTHSSRPQLAQRPQPLPPEKLDSLDSQSPAAQAARRDLRRVNWVMGNHQWLAKQLAQLTTEKQAQILELGAGDGSYCHYFQHLASAQIHGLDLSPRPERWPKAWRWTQGDLFAADFSQAPVIIASLVLHHFEPEQLAQLGQLCTQATELRFVEPARRRRHLLQGQLVRPLLHPITRYDMDLSIRAGFLPGELGSLLGLDPQDWQIEEELSFFGALRFQASRRPPTQTQQQENSTTQASK